MLELAVEIIGEALINLFINYPGALIRLVIFGKKEFDEYFEDDWEENVVPLLAIAIPAVIVLKAYGNTVYDRF